MSRCRSYAEVMPRLFSIFALFFVAWNVAGGVSSTPELEIPDGVSVVLTRNVDLTTQVVKVKVDYEVKNQGKSDINHIVHAISADEASSLSWIAAYEGKKESAKLRVSKMPTKNGGNFHFYKVELLSLLASGASTSLTVEYALTQHLSPYPEEITQSESQYVAVVKTITMDIVLRGPGNNSIDLRLVLYSGHANAPSAYRVEKETSSFKVGSTKPQSFTDLSGVSKFSGDKVAYGPFEDVKPFTQVEKFPAGTRRLIFTNPCSRSPFPFTTRTIRPSW